MSQVAPVWGFWAMRQSNGCWTPASRSSAATKSSYEEPSLKKNVALLIWPHRLTRFLFYLCVCVTFFFCKQQEPPWAFQPAVWGISCLVLLPSPCNDSACTYHSAIFVKPLAIDSLGVGHCCGFTNIAFFFCVSICVANDFFRPWPAFRGGARHFHLGGPLEGPVLQQGELSMVCAGLSERDLILGGPLGGPGKILGGKWPPLAPP